MMKKISVCMIMILLSAIAYAGLENFPENFMDGDNFDGYIVVGKDGKSPDVLGQAALGMKINLYAGKPQIRITKLDDEVSLDNNLILIGNPCVNQLVAELLDDPAPCDKDFPIGRAYIRFIEKDGNNYIIAAGNTPEENRFAAEYLSLFDKNDLKGDLIELHTGENDDAPKTDDSLALPPEGIVADPPTEEMPREGDTKKEEKAVDEPKQAKETGIVLPEKVIVEDKGFIQKVFDWFKGLFG